MLILALTYLTILGLGVVKVGFEFFGPVLCHGPREKPLVALTFDDGPEPESTTAVLDVLKRLDAPAAFFLVGRRVDRHPNIAQAILEAGHTLGNHTYHHHWWSNFLRKKGLTQEIESCQAAIFRATKVRPSYFRPPAGLTNPHLHSALKKSGLIMIGWDVRTFDTRSNPKKVFTRILNRTRSGSIILLHDHGKNPSEITSFLGELIPALRSRGFHIAGLPVLLDREAYH